MPDSKGKSKGPTANGTPVGPLQKARERLLPFFTANPYSVILERGTAPDSKIVVSRPWNDDSLIINVSSDDEELIEALNNLYLPERFIAIWHKDLEAFEVIFSLLPPESDLLSREFVFRHKDREFQCGFQVASKRLLLLAEHYSPEAASTTQFRNLGIIEIYAMSQKGTFHLPDGVKAISFWIRGISPWNEDDALDLARHLNFFMYYYDTRSPQIVILNAKSESTARQPQVRHPHGAFPNSIMGKTLDDSLLHFWAASIEGDPVRRFLYNFQILEYAASFWIEEDIKREIRRTLAAPNATDNIALVTDQVIEALGASKMQEHQKLEHLLKAIVNPALVWREIEGDLRLFTVPTVFDVGVTIQPIVKAGWALEDFSVNWIPAYSNAIRSIRNALSHGKEQRTSGVITPTTSNFQKLQIWLSPIAVAAREVMLYRNLL